MRKMGEEIVVVVATLLLLALVGVVEFSWVGDPIAQPLGNLRIRRTDPQLLEPVSYTTPVHSEWVTLGRKLFDDPRLSRDNSVACSTCHQLDNAGQDGRVVSRGIKGRTGQRNTPSVYNAALNGFQFWDGRARTLEEQVDGPILGHSEMASSWQDVILKLKADENYVQQFQSAFGGEITVDRVKIAIAEYERTLITPNSKFDRYLKGEKEALNALELQGYELFQNLGCISCHQGMNVGGNLFQRFGIMGGYPNEHSQDLGRFAVTGRDADKYVFRVPSLRNVALTAPYFHDGSVATLEQAIERMAQLQLGYKIRNEEVQSLVAFLYTLTGEFPQ